MLEALCKVKRDPEFTSCDYIDSIVAKLKNLPCQYRAENEHKKEVCWQILNKTSRKLPSLLSSKPANLKVRLSTLKLVSAISSCRHEPDGPYELPDFSKMFADSFLEKDEVTKKSLI